jgi:DOMON domain
MYCRRIATITLIVLLGGVAAATFSQDQHLAVSSTGPSVDGVVKAGEYTYARDFDHQLTLYASRTADTLCFGVVAITDGWVAVGLGSQKMDGAAIFMGFVDTDGKVSFKTETGKGHRHVDAPSAISASVISYAINQEGGKTTLEVAVKAASFIKQGQSSLDVICAMGKDRSFTSVV